MYLFTSGVLALLAVPFLTWFVEPVPDWGLRFPSQVSLIYLLERGYWPYLTFYLSGVAAAILVAAIVKRPVAFLGVLPAIFPGFTLFVVAVGSLLYPGYYGYTSVLTLGIFTAFLGSALLESSYFTYHTKSLKSAEPT